MHVALGRQLWSLQQLVVGEAIDRHLHGLLLLLLARMLLVGCHGGVHGVQPLDALVEGVLLVRLLLLHPEVVVHLVEAHGGGHLHGQLVELLLLLLLTEELLRVRLVLMLHHHPVHGHELLLVLLPDEVLLLLVLDDLLQLDLALFVQVLVWRGHPRRHVGLQHFFSARDVGTRDLSLLCQIFVAQKCSAKLRHGCRTKKQQCYAISNDGKHTTILCKDLSALLRLSRLLLSFLDHAQGKKSVHTFGEEVDSLDACSTQAFYVRTKVQRRREEQAAKQVGTFLRGWLAPVRALDTASCQGKFGSS